MKKTYFKIMYQVIMAFIIFGFIAPYLISAKSDELVIAGIVVILAELTQLFFFIYKSIKQINYEKK